MKKEILVIFTGGTISSRLKEDHKIGVSEKVVWQLLDRYEKSGREAATFHGVQPFTMLSENSNPAHWQLLTDTLKGMDFSRYAGVIVTHGTDTLPYTAALLGYLYGHLEIPLVLIGSNYPLADPRSNGEANFFAAVQLICQQRWKGVYVIFQDGKGRSQVYLPTRLLEADSYRDEFSAYGGVELGEVTSQGFVYRKDDRNPSVELLQKAKKPAFPYAFSFQKEIMKLSPYPGFNYQMISLEHKPAAILHGLYHSATACIEEENYSILAFIDRCRKKKIPVYVASVKPDENPYETGKALLDAGAIPLYNISETAAYMKLQLAYNQKDTDSKKLMEKQWYFEIIPSSRHV